MIKINLNSLNNVFSKVSDIKNNLTSTDTDKPLSAAQGKELKTQVDTKVDKVTGKELSSNDFTDSLKNKLENDVLSANFGYIDENLKMHFTVASLDFDVDDDIIQEGEKTNVQATLTDDKEEPIEGIRVNFYEIYTPTINLSGNNIIQSGERTDITAKLKDADGSLVVGERIDFYEIFTPTLLMSSDKDIIQSSQVADIKCKVKDEDGSLVSNQVIYFYEKESASSYNYIGKGVTDNTGVAHLTEDANGGTISGYTGTGSGKLDVVASPDKPIKSGSIVSETYEIWDCIAYDKGLSGEGNHNDATWDTSYSKCSLVRGAEYSTFTASDGTSSTRLNLLNLSSDCTVDFEYCQVNGAVGTGFVGVNDSSVGQLAYFSLQNLGYTSSDVPIGEFIKLRLRIQNGSATLTNIDDTTKTSTKTLSSGTPNIMRFSISSSSITEHRIREVKVY